LLLGVFLGAILGASVGTLFGEGDGYGSMAGMIVGALNGGITCWLSSRIRSALPKGLRARLLSAVIWVLGGLAIGGSAAALAIIGDTHEFWSPPLPLFGIPFLLFLGATLVELALVEAERRRPEKTRPGPIDLGDPTGQGLSYFTRRIWFIALLCALLDKAREIRLEPGGDGATLSCHGMERAKVPLEAVPAFVQEMKRLAGLESRLPAWTGVLRRLGLWPPAPSREGRLLLRLGDVVLEIVVSLEPAGRGERLVLRFPEHCLEPAQLEPLIRQLFEGPRPVGTGIEHVSQGEGNCAVATVAMLGGVDYEAVAASRRGSRSRPPYVRELTALLKRFTRSKWQAILPHSLPRQLDRVSFPEWTVVVWIRPPGNYRLSHCIAVKGQHVHDPNGTHAVRLDEYDKGDWHVALVFVPVRTGK